MNTTLLAWHYGWGFRNLFLHKLLDLFFLLRRVVLNFFLLVILIDLRLLLGILWLINRGLRSVDRILRIFCRFLLFLLQSLLLLFLLKSLLLLILLQGFLHVNHTYKRKISANFVEISFAGKHVILHAVRTRQDPSLWLVKVLYAWFAVRMATRKHLRNAFIAIPVI